MKHLEAIDLAPGDIDLISFRGEKPPKNPLQDPIVLDNQDPIRDRWLYLEY